jgi:hypothetical protein
MTGELHARDSLPATGVVERVVLALLGQGRLPGLLGLRGLFHRSHTCVIMNFSTPKDSTARAREAPYETPQSPQTPPFCRLWVALFGITYPKVANAVSIHGSAQNQSLFADFHRLVDMGPQPLANGFRCRHKAGGSLTEQEIP